MPGSGVLGLLADVPVGPDADTARRWAREELADPIYHEQPNLVQIIWEWVTRQLAQLQASAAGLDPLGLATVAVVVRRHLGQLETAVRNMLGEDAAP